MAGRVIVITSGKGGVGKTTTSAMQTSVLRLLKPDIKLSL